MGCNVPSGGSFRLLDTTKIWKGYCQAILHLVHSGLQPQNLSVRNSQSRVPASDLGQTVSERLADLAFE